MSGLRAAAAGHTEGSIVIELNQTQIDQVVRSASDGGGMSIALAGLADLEANLVSDVQRPLEIHNPRFSASLLSGLFLLASLPRDGSGIAVTELARVAGMYPSTTHRYLSTLLAVGLVEQDSRTRQYRLVSDPLTVRRAAPGSQHHG
jgi:DNA-binding transcriptional ArsR family regulator